jgi:hypothetical protein
MMRNIILALLTALTILTVSAPPVVVSASSKTDACQELRQQLSNGRQGCGTKGSAVLVAVRRVVSLVAFIAGIVGVIMIVVSGFRFITANGDASRVASARTSLVYAVVGLAIAAIAAALVRFALSASNGT